MRDPAEIFAEFLMVSKIISNVVVDAGSWY